jgi:hypothetical protein
MDDRDLVMIASAIIFSGLTQAPDKTVDNIRLSVKYAMELLETVSYGINHIKS